ncbi:cytochrome c oxidase assembly protein COX16 homolog, mitochondrial-like isoform X2 [Ostrea edulis]|uniref:cytochrome c oxidase assembly protein COX16 homolog, mitochondrial-like isoform X2 n=1 Tax=Ostrea edulis TaxID=37623 RepID=UPI002095E2EC|nr:cytochrome c oxidase assembly protein COX16 homolog, mitochondrial-like isoform X2 [Ostrea edulis]
MRMFSSYQQAIREFRRSPFFTKGLPLMLFMMTGTAILVQTQKLVYRRRDKKKSSLLTDKETQKFIEEFGQVKTLQELQKDTQKNAQIDKWANFRGPRPDDDKSMETFKKIKEEGDKQIKKTNIRIKGSEDWKKYQDKKSEWLETIKRHQDASMKNK